MQNGTAVEQTCIHNGTEMEHKMEQTWKCKMEQTCNTQVGNTTWNRNGTQQGTEMDNALEQTWNTTWTQKWNMEQTWHTQMEQTWNTQWSRHEIQNGTAMTHKMEQK